jgi:P-type E1-E2 ATPase
VIYVAQQTRVFGYVNSSDQCKPDSLEAVERQHKLGQKAITLTGDNQATASEIAMQLNLDGYVGRQSA